MIYGEEDGPFVRLVLPLEVVRTLRDVLYRHVSPSMGLDQALYDELGSQLQQQVVGDKVFELRLSVGGGPNDFDVYVNGEYFGYIEKRSNGTWIGDITDGNGPPSKPFADRDEAIAYVVKPY